MAPLTVYSNNVCPNCDNLKKALKLKGIAFEEINLSVRPEAADTLRALGMRNLPVVNIDGDWLMGFTAPNFNKILQSRLATA